MGMPAKFPVTLDNLPKSLVKFKAQIAKVDDKRDIGEGITVTTKDGHAYHEDGIGQVAYLVARGPKYVPNHLKVRRVYQWTDYSSKEYCRLCQGYEDDGCCCGEPNEGCCD